MDHDNPLRLVAVCPHHPSERLLTWYTADGVHVVTENPRGRQMVDVTPREEWTPEVEVFDMFARTSWTVPADKLQTPSVPAADGVARHLQMRLRCPRPSCRLNASSGPETRLAIIETVRAIWRTGYRGELVRTVTELGL